MFEEKNLLYKFRAWLLVLLAGRSAVAINIKIKDNALLIHEHDVIVNNDITGSHLPSLLSETGER